jgi:hypothetical protein
VSAGDLKRLVGDADGSLKNMDEATKISKGVEAILPRLAVSRDDTKALSAASVGRKPATSGYPRVMISWRICGALAVSEGVPENTGV